MIVPLVEGWADGAKREHVLVHHVVFPLVAILFERLGHLALAVDHDDVLPLATAGQFDFVLHCAIGIDRVAGMQEEVGRVLGDGRIGLHAGLVDAPALAGGVARPGEAHVALRGRRGAETADDRLGDGVDVGKVGSSHAVEDVLVGS